MLKKSVLTVAVIGACALPGIVFADEAAAPSPITGNLTLTTDYIFRGVSQTMGNPAVQGGFDYAHSSGLYVGTWASNVSGTQYTNANMEWDLYGGYTGKINDDLSYNVGGIYVYYPDGVTGPAPNKKWNTAELFGGATWKWFNVKASYSLTNWYGIGKDGGFVPTEINTAASSADDPANPDDSKGSLYLEANASYELPMKFVLSGHVGHQKINNYKELDYTDWKIGVSKDFSGFNVALAYTDTNAKKYNLYYVTDVTGDQKKLAEGAVILSVTKTF
ncbi:MAG: TorF family putative porin [Betaproteobacteria bacterium]